MSSACGKKGPPLAPLVRIPAPVETIDAQRIGSDVYVTFTIPTANVDDHTPADVDHVEIYGYTGPAAPPRARFTQMATRVALVPVAPPVTTETGRDEPPAADATRGARPAPAQGASVTIRDTLIGDELTPNPEPRIPNPEPGTGNPEQPLRRFYTALAFSPRGRWSPIGGIAEVPLLLLPDAPPHATARYDERRVTIAWEPAGGLVGFLLERRLPDEPPPVFTDADEAQAAAPLGAAAGPLTYNVYRSEAPDILALPDAGASWTVSTPEPLNRVPLASLSFTDSVEFGSPRCYTVRAVRGAGPDARISDPSPPACITPVDTFAPAPPRSLAAVATEGAISLIWEPSVEPDVGGYLVLRGDAPGDTLQPLTSTPVADARYRDEAVSPGVRYVYAVVALDSRFPVPNVSPESNRVEEAAR